MILPSQLLSDTVQLAANQRVLILNSAADPFVPTAAQQIKSGEIILAEDNIANLGRNGERLARHPHVFSIERLGHESEFPPEQQSAVATGRGWNKRYLRNVFQEPYRRRLIERRGIDPASLCVARYHI